MIKIAIVIALGLTMAGCSTARFAPTPSQQGYQQVIPRQQPRQPLDGPFDRAREDREFGGQQ